MSAELQTIIRQIGSDLESFRQEQSIPGMAVSIVSDQEIIYSGGVGVSSLETKSGVTPQTFFRAGSITKLFTATSLVQLHDRGLIVDLDEPVTNYIALPTYLSAITFRHLLTHRSGLPREAPLNYIQTLRFPSSQDIIDSLDKVELLSPAGTNENYSNLGYAILGYVIEQLTSKPYKQYISDEVLKPLKMRQSGFDLVNPHRPKMAAGYWLSGDSFEPTNDVELNLGGFACAGQLYSSVEDLARFVSWQIGSSSNTLSAKSRQEMWSGKNRLGWEVHEDDGDILVGHNGRTFGYSSDLVIAPKSKLGGVILTNLGFDPSPFRPLVKSFLKLLEPIFNSNAK